MKEKKRDSFAERARGINGYGDRCSAFCACYYHRSNPGHSTQKLCSRSVCNLGRGNNYANDRIIDVGLKSKAILSIIC